MKKIINAILISSNLLFASNALEIDNKTYKLSILDEGIKEKVIILDNQNEIITARELLQDFMTNDNKIDVIKLWIKEDKKSVEKLLFPKTTLTKLKLNKSSKDDFLFHSQVQMVLSIDVQSYLYEKEKIINELKGKYIPLIKIEDIKETLKQFEIIKKSQKKLYSMVKSYIKQSNNDEFKEFISLLKQVKELKQQIKTNRTNYISYYVISPYLVDTQRYIMLSDKDNLIGHNEQYLQKAAQSMAKGAYKDILLESNEDVRRQFYDTYQKLKELAGDKEWEDLKVLQTLMNSSSNAKKIGSDRWWE